MVKATKARIEEGSREEREKANILYKSLAQFMIDNNVPIQIGIAAMIRLVIQEVLRKDIPIQTITDYVIRVYEEDKKHFDIDNYVLPPKKSYKHKVRVVE